MKKFTIFLAGDLNLTARLKEQMRDSVYIAADGGIKNAEKANVKPDLWLGDFDSSEGIEKPEIEKITYPVDKNFTDGELAILHAINAGATDILICGAFGGERLDHCLAHIMLSFVVAQKGINIVLTSGLKEAEPIIDNETKKLNWSKDTNFSIISFSDLIGLKIRGAKWNLEGNEKITMGSTHTLSNINEGNLEIALIKGKALVIAEWVDGHIVNNKKL